jgi:hypothetical protein
MKPIRATGTIRAGKLHIDNRTAFEQAVGKAEDVDVEIVVDKLFATRSIQQLRYYWLIITLVTDHLRDEWQMPDLSKEDVHYYLAMQLDYKELLNPETGEVIKLPRSTKDSNTKELANRTENVRNYVHEHLGLVTPDPEKEPEKRQHA